MIKPVQINDCRYDFVDSQIGTLVFSFEAEKSITSLDIRKLQLASMIKGDWCNIKEIDYYLSQINCLTPYALGRIVGFFGLFNYHFEELISSLPKEIQEILSVINPKGNTNFFLFLIGSSLNKDPKLAQSLKGFCRYWEVLGRQNIKTLYGLVSLSKTELISLKYIGPKKADEIESLLIANGLQLKEEKK